MPDLFGPTLARPPLAGNGKPAHFETATGPARGHSCPQQWTKSTKLPITVRLPGNIAADGNVRAPTSAFTLIELMVVMVLIGVITAVVLPEMRGTYDDALLRSTSRDLVSACDLASSHAISANQPHRLHLDTKTGKYVIQRRHDERGREAQFMAAREVPGGEGELDKRINIEIHKAGEELPEPGSEDVGLAGSDQPQAGPRDDGIVFFPDGTAEASEILLQDRDGFRLALRINPTTARVRVVELARQ